MTSNSHYTQLSLHNVSFRPHGLLYYFHDPKHTAIYILATTIAKNYPALFRTNS